MGAVLTAPKRLLPVSRHDFPLSIENGCLLIDPSAGLDIELVNALPGITCLPRNWGRNLTGLPQIIDLARCSLGQQEWLHEILHAERLLRQETPLAQVAICGRICSDLSTQHVANHIASQLLVLPLNANGNQYTYGALWRFYDPRVFANLGWLLPSLQLSALLGPITKWAFPWLTDWYQCRSETLPFSSTNDEVRLHASGLLPVELGVWERVQRISAINFVLSRLALPESHSFEVLSGIAQQIETALVVAETKFHWNRFDDATGYAEYVMRYGPRFTEIPRLSEIWTRQEAGQIKVKFADVLAMLNPRECEALLSPVSGE